MIITIDDPDEGTIKIAFNESTGTTSLGYSNRAVNFTIHGREWECTLLEGDIYCLSKSNTTVMVLEVEGAKVKSINEVRGYIKKTFGRK